MKESLLIVTGPFSLQGKGGGCYLVDMVDGNESLDNLDCGCCFECGFAFHIIRCNIHSHFLILYRLHRTDIGKPNV